MEQSAFSWTEFLGPGGTLALCIVGMALVVAIVLPATIVGLCQWSAVRRREMTVGLVLELLDRGYSSGEITDLLRAGDVSAKAVEQALAAARQRVR